MAQSERIRRERIQRLCHLIAADHFRGATDRTVIDRYCMANFGVSESTAKQYADESILLYESQVERGKKIRANSGSAKQHARKMMQEDAAANHNRVSSATFRDEMPREYAT